MPDPDHMRHIALDQDAVIAAAGLVERSGARSFKVGYLHDDVPATLADWYAEAQYRGERIVEEHHRGPVEAAEALARRLLTGATCRCGRLVTLTDTSAVVLKQPQSVIAEQLRQLGLEMVSAKRAAKVGFCRWTRKAARWEPGCDAPPIRVKGRR